MHCKEKRFKVQKREGARHRSCFVDKLSTSRLTEIRNSECNLLSLTQIPCVFPNRDTGLRPTGSCFDYFSRRRIFFQVVAMISSMSVS